MNMKTSDQSNFEHRLAALLQTRADTVEVHPDLNHVTAMPSAPPPRRQPTAGAWWLAAAALLLVGGFGVSRLATDGDDALSTGSAATADDANDPAVSADATALLVWVRPNATPTEVEEIAGLLVESPAVLEIRTRGSDGRMGDFTDHFADRPGGVQLVDPERPPSAFRVITDSPGEVGHLVTGVAGLDGVEDTD